MSSKPVTLPMARASARAQPQGKSKRPGRADQRVREAGIVGWRLERGVILSVERSVDRDSRPAANTAGITLFADGLRSSTPTLDACISRSTLSGIGSVVETTAAERHELFLVVFDTEAHFLHSGRCHVL